MRKVKEDYTIIVDSSNYGALGKFGLKFEEEVANVKVDILGNVFTLLMDGKLYFNKELYEENCLHLLVLNEDENGFSQLIIVYKDNFIEKYHYKNGFYGKKRYDKVLFNYNCVAALENDRLWVLKYVIVDYACKKGACIDFFFDLVTNFEFIYETVVQSLPDIDEDNCVELLEIIKNGENFTLGLPCIELVN